VLASFIAPTPATAAGRASAAGWSTVSEADTPASNAAVSQEITPAISRRV